MRLIICGGRDFSDHSLFHSEIEKWVAEHGRPEQVITGGANGADSMGKTWAEQAGIDHREFPADWATHGRGAGPKRNYAMAEYAAQTDGAVLAFPGGRGTVSMIHFARRLGLHVTEV